MSELKVDTITPNTVDRITGIQLYDASQWRVTADFAGTVDPIASNWEEVDTDGYGTLGSSVTEASGIFTMPAAGIYWINWSFCSIYVAADGYTSGFIKTTVDNSSYTDAAVAYANMYGGRFDTASISFLFDCVDTSTHKVAFRIVQNTNTSNKVIGDSGQNENVVTFLRLGDT